MGALNCAVNKLGVGGATWLWVGSPQPGLALYGQLEGTGDAVEVALACAGGRRPATFLHRQAQTGYF